jgi:HD-GYP domain-containing protein (c-di-GMP phosphodiesterase class II)
MVLGRSIYGSRGRLLLNAGKALDTGFIKRIRDLGFSGAYIDAPGFESVMPQEIVDPALRTETHSLLSDCFEALTNLSSFIRELDLSNIDTLSNHPEFKRALPLGKIQSQVNQIIEELSDQYTAELPCLLLKAQGQYQVEHATDTMILSLLLGIRSHYIYRELKQLGLAALLHDVGKSLLIKGEEKNIGPEHPRYREHPALGAAIVLENGTNHYVESASIRQHHERQDGRGFPDGLIGYNKSPENSRAYQSGTIYRHAEIVAVADAYDVMTSGAFGPRLSPEEAITNLLKRSFFEFNSHIVTILAQVVQIFPVGSQVRIVMCSDERLQDCRGIVKTANSDHPHRAEIILTNDNLGYPTKPITVSLQDDEFAQLELLL